MNILVVNAGSSSLKLRVIGESDRLVASIDLEAPDERLDRADLEHAITALGPVDVVGHRIVHGGTQFTGPVRIDDDVVRDLRALTDLAPLHQPKSLAALDAVTAVLPHVPAVACFDTAFHAGIPAAAATYALPAEWRQRWNVRRFGFHGLSHAYATRRVGELLGRPMTGVRLVTCHLGAGASLAAIIDGRSVDTTMGFTPLEGLVMATRSGSVDPGLLLWLEEHVGMAPARLAEALEHRSGLLGLAGTADMREVLARAANGDERATLALDVYVHRLRSSIASMAAAIGGLDVLAFMGGVGEHAPVIRETAAAGLAWLGVVLDAERNEHGEADRAISAASARVHSFVIEAREDLEIAREVRSIGVA